MRNVTVTLFALASLSLLCQGFVSKQYQKRFHLSQSMSTVVNDPDLPQLGLTPELEKYVKGFRSVADDKVRYQQLFFLASKCLPMDDALKLEQNKVPGCLSTVHIHATSQDDKIFYVGDSDAQMTKGLVALLVNGLSGHTYEEISAVQPDFIKYAGIGGNLTPGRNNGFLNMMKTMKDKARALHSARVAEETSTPEASTTTAAAAAAVGGPIYRAILTKLSMLKPEQLVIEDESYKHAGHSGMQGSDSIESHFNVRIIASCFDGMSLVLRHKMVYTLLGAEMNNGIHALSIYAKTPTEEANK